MSQGKGSAEAAATLKAAMAVPLKAIAATVDHLIDLQTELRKADDLVEVLKAAARLTLACEVLKGAASGGTSVGRAALAETFAGTGIPAVQIESFTVSLKQGEREVRITDEKLVPEKYWVQPPQPPQPPRQIDKTAIGKDLRADKPVPVPGAALSNGAAPTIQFRKRDAA